MKAKLIYRDKIIFADGSIMELVLWNLPKTSLDRPHSIKYRLYYSDANGNCIVRYDNETGKGDHKHIKDEEFPYKFMNKDQLIEDFWRDVLWHRGELR